MNLIIAPQGRGGGKNVFVYVSRSLSASRDNFNASVKALNASLGSRKAAFQVVFEVSM